MSVESMAMAVGGRFSAMSVVDIGIWGGMEAKASNKKPLADAAALCLFDFAVHDVTLLAMSEALLVRGGIVAQVLQKTQDICPRPTGALSLRLLGLSFDNLEERHELPRLIHQSIEFVFGI